MSDSPNANDALILKFISGANDIFETYMDEASKIIIAEGLSGTKKRGQIYLCYHAYGEQNSIISDHSLYNELAHDLKSRLACYRELFKTDVGKETLHAIRKAINFSMPLGNNRFQEEIERTLKRKTGYAKRGRPGKENQTETAGVNS